ncbi:MAG: 2-oxoacid:acceptor oxidoreductase family protein [Anaerolineae bacterium]
MARKEVKLAGFGGQGIILAGYILGKAAAIYDGKNATFTQSYGPESRGGACSAEVVISDEPVHYPRLIHPDVLVVMSQEAYDKYIHELGGEGLLLFDEDLVKFVFDEGIWPFSIPATRLAEGLGNKIVANIIMLGFFSSITDFVSVEAMREAVRTSVPTGMEGLNLRAFEEGYKYRATRRI